MAPDLMPGGPRREKPRGLLAELLQRPGALIAAILAMGLGAILVVAMTSPPSGSRSNATWSFESRQAASRAPSPARDSPSTSLPRRLLQAFGLAEEATPVKSPERGTKVAEATAPGITGDSFESQPVSETGALDGEAAAQFQAMTGFQGNGSSLGSASAGAGGLSAGAAGAVPVAELPRALVGAAGASAGTKPGGPRTSAAAAGQRGRGSALRGGSSSFGHGSSSAFGSGPGGGATRFGSQAAPATQTTGAGPAAAIGPAGGNPVAGGASIGAPGGSRGGETGPGSGGQPGGGVPPVVRNQDAEIQAFDDAANAFAAQEPLVRGRGFVLCLIKAFKIRYTDARNHIDSMTDAVARARDQFRGPRQNAAAANTLAEFHAELISDQGLRTRFRRSVERLGRGEDCFPRDMSHAETTACYEDFQGPIRGRDLIVKEIGGFVNIVQAEGDAALAGITDPDDRAYLQSELAAYKNSLEAAETAITGLNWGNEQEVITLANQFFDKFREARETLNDIDPSLLPDAQRPKFETAARNANLSLAKANSAWIEMPQRPSQHDKLVRFIEAHHETQEAAMDLAEAQIALELRPPPPPGGSPSPQLSPVPVIPVNQCDPPPPPPPGGGKK